MPTPSRYRLRNFVRTLYAKIFLWFCATILAATVMALVIAFFTGTQPLGRRWLALTQDMYAHSAVDFYVTGGAGALEGFLKTLEANTGIEGQLIGPSGGDVLDRTPNPDTAAVLERCRITGRSGLHVGRVWTAASPVTFQNVKYIFLMEVHPLRRIGRNGFLDGRFANSMIPRILLGVLVIAVCCLMLARHITEPIRIMEEGALELASGRLSVRVGPRIAPRQDELARMAGAFDQMAERIQALVAAQQEMFGHVSHELRSPLTRIGVSLELLRRGEQDSLDQMQLDLDRMNQMIGEILEITRMDIQAAAAGHRGLPVALELTPLLTSISDDAAFESRQVRKKVEFTIDDHCVVLGDPGELRSCFENVVRNALLYSEEGTTIRIRLASEASDHKAVILIEDEGPGVPPEALDRIFELFYRVGEAAERHPEGTGFGLAITQRIVALHGGCIAARNLSPRGLEVRIELPLAAAATRVS